MSNFTKTEHTGRDPAVEERALEADLVAATLRAADSGRQMPVYVYAAVAALAAFRAAQKGAG